jgi:hypothetical protein
MFPCKLYHEKVGKVDIIFRHRPELIEFMRPLDKQKKVEKNLGEGGNAKPINHCYKDKSGSSYGLYQRFYWDQHNVPFGGIPNFQR